MDGDVWALYGHCGLIVNSGLIGQYGGHCLVVCDRPLSEF